MSTSTAMEVTGEGSNPSKKRRLENLDGTDDRGTAGGNLALEKNDKIMAHKFVAELYGEMVRAFSIPKKFQTDFIVSDYLINQAASVHNCMRSKEATTSNTRKYDLFVQSKITLTLYGKTFEADPAVLVACRENAAHKATGSKTLNNKIMGNIQTIFGLWQLFGERLEEVKYGSDYKIRNKKNGEGGLTLIRASKYGLDPASRHYWSGLMWSLPVQSALCQSMGPLAVALRLSDSDGERFGHKWKTTFIRHFGFLPYVQDIADILLRGHASSPTNKEILTQLSKMVVVSGARDVQRIVFPPCFLHWYLNQPGNLDHFDFSGNGAYIAYKAFSTWNGTVPQTNHQTQLEQLIFHAMLGTHVEDFKILEYMTNYNSWVRRQEISDSLIKVEMKIPGRTEADIRPFQPIKIVHYAKMSSAMMSNLLGGGVAPMVAKAVLSGYRTRHVPDSLKKYIEKDVGTTGGGLGPDEVKAALRRDLSKAMEALRKDNTAGTVPWRRMDDLTPMQNGTQIVGHVVKESGIFYHSQQE